MAKDATRDNKAKRSPAKAVAGRAHSAAESGPAKPRLVSGEVRDFPDGPPDESGLTPRQRKVLEVIRDSVERRGYPPSMREIGEAVGLTSSSSVSHQLATLERKGFLRRDPNRPRAIEVRHPDAESATGPVAAPSYGGGGDVHDLETGSGDIRPAAAYVPVVGRIAAGGPTLRERAGGGGF